MINYDSNTTNEVEVTCPYCGYKYSDSWEFPNEDEVDCDCGNSFHMIRDVEVSYSAYKKVN